MDYDEIPDWYGEENAGNLRYLRNLRKLTHFFVIYVTLSYLRNFTLFTEVNLINTFCRRRKHGRGY